VFRQHFQPPLDQLAMNERRVIDLKNPELPPQTPLQRSELWWQPTRRAPVLR